MKKLILGIVAIFAIASLSACGNTPKEVEKIPEVNNTQEIVNPVISNEKTEEEIVRDSLISGGEWKPTVGIYTNEDGTILEMEANDIYGKYAGVGGATFHEDGTFTKFVGVFDGEEEADKTGTYTINTDERTITFNYSRGENVNIEYEMVNDGEVMYFIYPEDGDIYVRFEPTFQISLKNNEQEAKYQIEVALKNLLKKAYGTSITDIKINSLKIYSIMDEQENEPLKEMNLGDNEVAFEVNYELKAAENADIMSLTAATGVYDEESGWVKEKFNLGIIRPDANSESKYVITDFGTGW